MKECVYYESDLKKQAINFHEAHSHLSFDNNQEELIKSAKESLRPFDTFYANLP